MEVMLELVSCHPLDNKAVLLNICNVNAEIVKFSSDSKQPSTESFILCVPTTGAFSGQLTCIENIA